MYLAKINAVNEGTWGLALLCIITGFVGPELWKAAPLGFELNKIMFVTFMAISGVTFFMHSKKILSKTDKMDYFLKSRFSLVFIVLSWLIHLFNPSFKDYTFMIAVILNVSKITILCQIAHVTKKEFQPIRFMNLAAAVIMVLALALSVFSQDIGSLRHTVFALSAFDFINFAVVAAARMAKLLAIKVFKVKKNPGAGEVKPGTETNAESVEFKKEANNESVPDENL